MNIRSMPTAIPFPPTWALAFGYRICGNRLSNLFRSSTKAQWLLNTKFSKNSEVSHVLWHDWSKRLIQGSVQVEALVWSTKRLKLRPGKWSPSSMYEQMNRPTSNLDWYTLRSTLNLATMIYKTYSRRYLSWAHVIAPLSHSTKPAFYVGTSYGLWWNIWVEVLAWI